MSFCVLTWFNLGNNNNKKILCKINRGQLCPCASHPWKNKKLWIRMQDCVIADCGASADLYLGMWGSSRGRVAYSMNLYPHKLSLSLAGSLKAAFPQWVRATEAIFSCADISATFLWVLTSVLLWWVHWEVQFCTYQWWEWAYWYLLAWTWFLDVGYYLERLPGVSMLKTTEGWRGPWAGFCVNRS